MNNLYKFQFIILNLAVLVADNISAMQNSTYMPGSKIALPIINAIKNSDSKSADFYLKALPENFNPSHLHDEQDSTIFNIVAEKNDLSMFLLLQSFNKLNNYERDGNKLIDIVDHNGNTPLINASKSGSYEIVALLLQAKANKYIKNKEGKTAIDIAIEIQKSWWNWKNNLIAKYYYWDDFSQYSKRIDLIIELLKD